MSYMKDDDYGKVAERPRHSGTYRRRDYFVLPGWAWPLIGVGCLLLGIVLGWFLWRYTSTPEPTPAPPTTALAAAATSTPLPALATPTASVPLPTATFTPLPTPTNTPPPTATPTLALQITVGGRVKVGDTSKVGLRLRAGPGLDFVTFKNVDEGSILEVLGGPEKGDNYTWWRLKDDKGVIGWAVADFLIPVP